jgi:arylsulfatase A-like enzyme
MIGRIVWLVGVTVILAIGALGASLAAPAPAGRDLILITVESLRADRLGCYGGPPASTPAIDSLARRGLRFSRAYAASPSTAPSVASLMTGLDPARHGLRHDLGGRLAADVETLASRLRAAGYESAAVVGSFHLDSRTGLERGFGDFDDIIRPSRRRTALLRERRAEEVVEKALRFLDTPRRRPFLLWLDFYDPHYDYGPPPPFKDSFDKDPYAGEIAYLDSQIGALLQGLRARRLEKKTHVILAASHGEGLGDHGETGHGIYLHETTIRVPLIVAPAGWRPPPGKAPGSTGAVDDDIVGLVDLMPTILEWLGAPVPPDLDGRSFARRLSPVKGRAPAAAAEAPPRRHFAEAVQPHAAYGWSPLFAIIEERHKVVQGQRLEAFDLAADPGESRPLDPVPPWAADLVAHGRARLGSLDPPEAARRAVAEAGLAIPWSNSPICLEKQNWPDPRDRVGLNDRLFRARIAMEQSQPGTAAILGEEVLESDPANYTGLEAILFLGLRNRWGDALLGHLEIMQCDYPFRGAGYHSFAHHLQRKGDLEQAEEAFLLFARLEPHDREALHDLAAFYASQGKRDLAFDYLEKALALGPRDLEDFRRDGRLFPLKDDPRYHSLLRPPAGPAAGTKP